MESARPESVDGYVVGDLVMGRRMDGLVGTARRLRLPFEGPFHVVEVFSNGLLRLEDTNKRRVKGLVNVDRVKPFVEDDLMNRWRAMLGKQAAAVVSLCDEESDNDASDVLPDGQWLVDRIVGRRRAGRGYRYRVRWEGYGASEDSWLLACDVDPALVEAYNVEAYNASLKMREAADEQCS
eukprot:Rmarinus@m.27497